ncbi:MAG: alpha/beta hydrolase [Pseudomonadota bacterium]
MSKPLLHFSHGNSFPAGTYRRFLGQLDGEYDIRAVDMHGHDPAFLVSDGWPGLVAELIGRLETYRAPAILVGHSLGGMLSLMAARQRPELVRCVVMLDSPVVAGWRAALLRVAKAQGWGKRWSPARLSENRRNIWPDRQAAFDHFQAKPLFAAWAPGVLADYIEHGLKPHPQGVQLSFSRDVETAIYRGLPHHIGSLMRGTFPVPAGFIGGTDSTELKQAGLGATRRLVGANFTEIEGGHLFPMESPELAARLTREMLSRLLPGAKNEDRG